MKIKLLNKKPKLSPNTIITSNKSYKTPKDIPSSSIKFIDAQKKLGKKIIPFYTETGISWVVFFDKKATSEDYRILGADLATIVNKEKTESLTINSSETNSKDALNFLEGFLLSAYRFVKYYNKSEKQEQTFFTTKIDLYQPKTESCDIEYLQNNIKAVFWTRNLVNEPVNFMNATQFAQEVATMGKDANFKVEVLDKKQIESLKMGGLLAVNKGSIDPPTFTICEWKPKNAVNKKPFVLVGKGVMYDTGGLSLKPTANSMDLMKSDMAGAAAMAGSIYSIALNKLPVWVIALLPATDNRPDGNAYTPGDIIKMYNGLHVEVLNTDAEGRMILADALSYGDKFDPELVIDMATLTGSAQMAIGTKAAVFMGNANDTWFDKLTQSGFNVHERIVRFPFWDDYKKSLKSNVADLKNLGSGGAGAITAGKFLEHFTKSPYIHIDIAGPAFLSASEAYRPIGASGYGVRLLADFFKNIANTK